MTHSEPERGVTLHGCCEPDFGQPSARKTGRDPRWPYVPVIKHSGTSTAPKPWVEQIRGLAFATRPEALSCAEAHITKLRARFAEKLADPKMRALRAYYGAPRQTNAISTMAKDNDTPTT